MQQAVVWLPVAVYSSRKEKAMNYLKKVAVLAAAFAAVLTVSASAQTNKFPDVDESALYADDVNKLVDAGVLNGYEDGTFRPEGNVTRAEMCKMVTLSFKLTADLSSVESFPDINDNDWYKPYALNAKANGVVEGYDDGSFRGGAYVTREQVCAIINRIQKLYDLGISVTVTDDISEWAKQDVLVVLQNKLMPLESNNTFRATEPIKRYELATVLSKFVVDTPEPVTANIRFFVDGKQLGETDTVLVGEYPTVPEDPTSSDESLYFEGWRIVGTDKLVDPKIQSVEKDVDFEAVFAKKTYKVSFYNGKTLVFEETVEHGSPVPTAPAPSKVGYTFEFWSLSESGSAVASDYKITAETILYAQFSKDAETITTYKVTFRVDAEIFDTQSVAKGAYASEPTDAPELDGYKFVGWCVDNDTKEVVDVSKYKINASTTFYAVFEKIENPNSEELMEKLTRGRSQLAKIRLTEPKAQRARSIIVNCIAKVLDDAEAGELITKDYVNRVYKDDVDAVETIVMDEMTTREASDFKTAIANNVDKDVQDFLKEYFLDGMDI